MSTLNCKGCGGAYDTHTEDGAQYFHVCPRSTPPADQRDENPKSTAAKDAGSVKTAGKGVTVLVA